MSCKHLHQENKDSMVNLLWHEKWPPGHRSGDALRFAWGVGMFPRKDIRSKKKLSLALFQEKYGESLHRHFMSRSDWMKPFWPESDSTWGGGKGGGDERVG